MSVASSEARGQSPRSSAPGRRPAVVCTSLLGLGTAWLACSLDFAIERELPCPPGLVDCLACNPDGSCRVAAPPLQTQPRPDASAPAQPDASLGEPEPVADAGLDAEPPEPAPDANAPPPPPPECAGVQTPVGGRLCLEGDQRCFELQDVLGPALVTWLDPTTLPTGGSRYWCDRSGNAHHAMLVPGSGELRVEADGRALPGALARSLALAGVTLEIDERTSPLFGSEDLAVVVAAAVPLEPASELGLALFESGGTSRIGLEVRGGGASDAGSDDVAVAWVAPAAGEPLVVRTLSSVHDGQFHLYTLSRRSQVQNTNDVLQLRLNGVLEDRASSLPIDGAFDFSLGVPHATWIGRGFGTAGTAPGNGRIAAIVIVSDSVPARELTRLETFLCEELAVCTPPAPRPLPAAAGG